MKESKSRLDAEDSLLKTLTIKCKVCNAIMATGHREGVRYYHCKNNTKHEDNLDRFVWVDMPDWMLEEASDSRKTDTEFSCEKKNHESSKD